MTHKMGRQVEVPIRFSLFVEFVEYFLKFYRNERIYIPAAIPVVVTSKISKTEVTTWRCFILLCALWKII